MDQRAHHRRDDLGLVDPWCGLSLCDFLIGGLVRCAGVRRYPAGPYVTRSMNMAFALTVPTGGPSGSIVGVPLALSAMMSGGSFSISWAGGGMLQYANDPAGPWIDIEGAVSPYQTPPTAPQ